MAGTEGVEAFYSSRMRCQSFREPVLWGCNLYKLLSNFFSPHLGETRIRVWYFLFFVLVRFLYNSDQSLLKADLVKKMRMF